VGTIDVAGHTFTVTQPGSVNCLVPTNPYANNITQSTAKLHWTTQTGAIGYYIQYRKSTEATWAHTNSNSGTFNLSGLVHNTTYKWRVRSKCSTNPNVFSSYTAIQTFTTLPRLGIPTETFSSVDIIPNPTSSNFTLSFSNPDNKPVQIDLLNILGQQEREIYPLQFILSAFKSVIRSLPKSW
jgi:hypothetical protein